MVEIRIAAILGLFVLALAAMWLASPRTRRLATFAVIFIAVAAALVGLLVLVRVLWFPNPPAYSAPVVIEGLFLASPAEGCSIRRSSP